MITYRAARSLRLRRMAVSEPPFCARTLLQPYSSSLTYPLSINYLDLTIAPPPKGELTFCEDVSDSLDRERHVAGPVLVDATGRAETPYLRGSQLTTLLCSQGIDVTHLVSADGAIAEMAPQATVMIVAWPLDVDAVERLAASAAKQQRWGIVLPIVPGISTDLETVNAFCERVLKLAPGFLTTIPIEANPHARSHIATIRDAADDETFASLFDGRDDTVVLATERHVAALAFEAEIPEGMPLPANDRYSNWNAASLLARCAAKMLRLERDVELAWLLQRSAALLAELKKPLTVISEAASLSIIEGLDEVSLDILQEWMDGLTPAFVERLDAEWRLRRDLYR